MYLSHSVAQTRAGNVHREHPASLWWSPVERTFPWEPAACTHAHLGWGQGFLLACVTFRLALLNEQKLGTTANNCEAAIDLWSQNVFEKWPYHEARWSGCPEKAAPWHGVRDRYVLWGTIGARVSFVHFTGLSAGASIFVFFLMHPIFAIKLQLFSMDPSPSHLLGWLLAVLSILEFLCLPLGVLSKGPWWLIFLAAQGDPELSGVWGSRGYYAETGAFIHGVESLQKTDVIYVVLNVLQLLQRPKKSSIILVNNFFFKKKKRKTLFLLALCLKSRTVSVCCYRHILVNPCTFHSIFFLIRIFEFLWEFSWTLFNNARESLLFSSAALYTCGKLIKYLVCVCF